MTKKYKILAKFISDMSSETKDIETYIFVKDRIGINYKLGIDIKSKALKNKMIEVSTLIKFEDKENVDKKSFFEIKFSTIINIVGDVKEKSELEKILLCDVQEEILPDIEKSFLDMLQNSGYPGFTFEKKLDFKELYKQRTN
mgnify:CR=1 FL=1|tara:strand:- start:257 stop:682 length:426 start_codon:yes stop_codon:yes gene_type:complete